MQLMRYSIVRLCQDEILELIPYQIYFCYPPNIIQILVLYRSIVLWTSAVHREHGNNAEVVDAGVNGYIFSYSEKAAIAGIDKIISNGHRGLKCENKSLNCAYITIQRYHFNCLNEMKNILISSNCIILLQINSVINSGSTGRIAGRIGRLAINNGWKKLYCLRKNDRPSESLLGKIRNNRDINGMGCKHGYSIVMDWHPKKQRTNW